jgi:hypothetical protein
MKFVFPKDSPGRVRENAFLWGDPIELDLTFRARKSVSGRFLDEHGAPVASVKLNLSGCDYIDQAGHESHRNFREFWAIQQAREVMADLLSAESDTEGRFAFDAVPPEAICWLLIEHEKFAEMALYTSTARRPPREHDEHPVEPLPLKVTLKSVRTIPVTVVSAVTGELLSDIHVSGYQQQASGYTSWGTSNDNGEVTLKLPRGAYRLVGDPPRDSAFVRTYQELRVTEMPDPQPTTLKMNLGCVLTLKATDADTGAGISDVTFWFVPEDQPKTRFSVQSTSNYVDHPCTNEQGELRAIILPGKRAYGIGFSPLPDGYEAVNPMDRSKGRIIEAPSGKTVVEEFKLRKQK